MKFYNCLDKFYFPHNYILNQPFPFLTMFLLIALINPTIDGRLPVDQLLITKPQGNLFAGRLIGIRSMYDVTANLDAQIASDGTRETVSRIRLTQHDTSCLYCVEALPDHRDDRSAAHILNERGEERLVSEIGIVLPQELFRSLRSNQINN